MKLILKFILGGYNDQVKRGNRKPTLDLFDLGAATFGVTNANNKPKHNPFIDNSDRYDSKNIYTGDTANRVNPNINEVIDVKLSVMETADSFVESKALDTDLSYRTGYFTVQIYQNSTKALNDPFAIEQGLPLMDVSKCEEKIREYYGFPPGTTIPIGKVNWDPSLSDAENVGDVSYVFYNPYTGDKINQAKICKDIGVQIKMPVNTTGINMTDYEIFKNKSIDILDPDGEFFNNRCIPYANSTSGGDVPLNDRRKRIFQNTAVSCSVGCEYKGIDKNNYTICDCKETNSTQAAMVISSLPGLQSSNIEIFICFDSAFTTVKFY